VHCGLILSAGCGQESAGRVFSRQNRAYPTIPRFSSYTELVTRINYGHFSLVFIAKHEDIGESG